MYSTDFAFLKSWVLKRKELDWVNRVSAKQQTKTRLTKTCKSQDVEGSFFGSKMETERKQQIRHLADLLRESLKLGVPVDVNLAVTRLGGVLEEKQALEDGMEAKIAQDGESFKIEIERAKPALRKRFSIAHELGHLFVHMGYLIDPNRWSACGEYQDSAYYRFGHGIEEEEANEFAATFLMPEQEFLRFASELANKGAVSLPELAERFGTSVAATRLRGEALGVFSAQLHG